MRARRPAASLPVVLAALLLPALPGCGNFWEPPGGSTSTGGTATTTTLTAANSSVSAGGSDTLTASVSPTAATGTVTFYSDSNSIGSQTLSSGVASVSYTFATAGSYSITATYGGNSTYASSTSSAITVTVTASSAGAWRIGSLNTVGLPRRTNLVLDPAGEWSVPANLHVHNVAGVALSNGEVQNIESDGHCVFYSGSVYFAAGSQAPSGTPDGVYELPGGGYLSPEGTSGLGCE